jgi:hypothetical protein
MIVDGTSLAVMKDASPRQVPELSAPILIDDEVVVREPEAPYSDDIKTAQFHLGIPAALCASEL